MNTFVFGMTTKWLEEIDFSVYGVLKISEEQTLFEGSYHYVRYVKPCKAGLTVVALDNDELIHYGFVAKLDS